MTDRVAVVTDSTSGLTAQDVAGLDVEIVPLHVLVGDEEFVEGVDITPAEVVARLRRGPRVSTSRPSPSALLETYERLADRGATAIVSAHLPAQLSGTLEAAHLAARRSPVPVTVLDPATIALGLGYAVRTGARAAREGAPAADVAAAVAARGRATSVMCCVHSLEHLRRGGRIGAASSLLGSALAIKPLLALVDGHLEPVEKLRTTARATARLVELGAHAAGVAEAPVEIAVHHVDAAARAEKVAEDLRERLVDGPEHRIDVREASAVLAVHLGPGTVGLVVAPAPLGP